MFREAAYYTRMAYYFLEYLRTPVLANPAEVLRQNISRREHNFLELARTAVYDNPVSPYHQLLKLAGCSWNDLSESVRRDGLERSLERLRAAGVYLTHAETKGTQLIVRQGREIANAPGACRNPGGQRGMTGGSSGSRSAGSTSETSTAWRVYRESYEALLREEFNLHQHSEVSLMPILPASWGISHGAASSRLGGRVERWFTSGGTMLNAGHYRAVTQFLVAEGRLLGEHLPFPEYLRAGDFEPVVGHLAACTARRRFAFVRGTVSAVTRVCSAAREKGADISGTVFLAGGETMTAARRELIESLGCLVYSRYVANEVGPIGIGCRCMATGNTVHFFHDSAAVIVHRRKAPLAEVEVDSLLFTTLNPLAGRIFINAEIDDSGRLLPVDCNCAFARAGFGTAITNIESFGKLTGFGMTLVGSQLLGILETRLPARFGGSPADFQLVERAVATQMELKLLVHPRLGCDPTAVREFFLDEIESVYGGALTRRTWEHAQNLDVVCAPPMATKTGKVLPLHLATFEKRVCQ